jgi:hypothetical protein
MTFGMTVGVGGGGRGHVFNDAGKRDEKNCVKVSKEIIIAMGTGSENKSRIVEE